MKKLILTESQVKMLIRETTMEEVVNNINTELDDLNEPPFTADEIDNIAGCEADDSEVPNEHKATYEKVKLAIDNATVDQLKDAFRQVRAAKRNQKQLSEQAAAPVLLFGIPVTTVALIAIGGLLLISILSRLIKNILSREKVYHPSCKAGWKVVRKSRDY